MKTHYDNMKLKVKSDQAQSTHAAMDLFSEWKFQIMNTDPLIIVMSVSVFILETT